MLSFSSADVMRYFGKRGNQSGDIPAKSNGTLETDLKRRQEGERVKYRMNGNSAKFYDKAYGEIGSVLRGAETTIRTVPGFRVYRSKQGGPEQDLQWRRLRKGIADLHRRAEVSQKANEGLLNALASVDDSRSVLRPSAASPACCGHMDLSRRYLAPTVTTSPKPDAPSLWPFSPQPGPASIN
jgi:hypothetical protein